MFLSRSFRRFIWAAPLMVLSVPAFASGIYNTGVNSSGALISVGTDDPNYPLSGISTCCGGGVPNYAINPTESYSGGPAWVGDTSTAQWIGDGTHSSAYFSFTTTFNVTADELSGPYPLDLSFELGLSADYDTIQLNGTANDAGNSFAEDYGTSLHEINVTNGFVAGTNTLRITEAWTGPDQSTLGNANVGIFIDQAQLSQETPEPGTSALMGIALIGGAAFLRRRRLS